MIGPNTGGTSIYKKKYMAHSVGLEPTTFYIRSQTLYLVFVITLMALINHTLIQIRLDESI